MKKIQPQVGEFANGFRVDDDFLQNNLFILSIPPNKDPFVVNINILPNLVQSIIRLLDEEERACLIDYELQTHLIETLSKAVEYPSPVSFRDFILNHIRYTPKFWIANSIAQKKVQIKRTAKKRDNQEFARWHVQNPTCSRQDFDLAFKTEEKLQQEIAELIKEENSIILNAIENYIKYLDDLKEIVKEQPCLKGFCKNDLLENQDIERESAEIERLMVQKTKIIRPNGVYFGGNDQQDDQYSRNSQYKTSSSSSNLQQLQALQQQQTAISEEGFNFFMQNKNLLVPDMFFSNSKLDFFILPIIFAFVKNRLMFINPDVVFTKQRDVRVQNLIFQLLLSSKSIKRKSRSNKSYFLSQKQLNSKNSSGIRKKRQKLQGKDKSIEDKKVEDDEKQQRESTESMLNEQEQNEGNNGFESKNQSKMILEEEDQQAENNDENDKEEEEDEQDVEEYKLFFDNIEEYRDMWINRNLLESVESQQQFKEQTLEIFSHFCETQHVRNKNMHLRYLKD